MAKFHARREQRAASITAFIVAALFALPAYWMVATAFKQPGDVQRADPKLVPLPPFLGNITAVLGDAAFWSGLRNSIIVTVATVAAGTLLAFVAAIALARYRFRGRTAFLVVLILAQMVPAEALFVPFYVQLRDVHLLGSLLGLGAVYLSFTLPFAIWMLRGFVVAVPAVLEEAAMMDGASRFQAFRRVLFPLIAPGLLATSIFGFITAWNEFTYGYILLNNPEQYTLPVYLQSFTGIHGTEYGPQMAVATLFCLPVVALFVAMHKRAVSGISGGAVKG